MKVRACVLWAFGTLTSAPAALRRASQQFLIAQGWRGDRLGKGCAYGFSKALVTSVLVCLRSLLVMWMITSLQDQQFPFNDGMISLHYHDDSDVWTKVYHEELGQDGQVEARFETCWTKGWMTTLKVATGAPGKRKAKVGWDRSRLVERNGMNSLKMKSFLSLPADIFQLQDGSPEQWCRPEARGGVT